MPYQTAPTIEDLLPGADATDADWAAYEDALFTHPAIELHALSLTRVVVTGDEYYEARARLVRALAGPAHPHLSWDIARQGKGEFTFIVEGLTSCRCHPFRLPILQERVGAWLV